MLLHMRVHSERCSMTTAPSSSRPSMSATREHQDTSSCPSSVFGPLRAGLKSLPAAAQRRAGVDLYPASRGCSDQDRDGTVFPPERNGAWPSPEITSQKRRVWHAA